MQLRQYSCEFQKRQTEVLIIGPDGPRAFRKFWNDYDMPFVGCADIGSRISDLYQQEVNIMKLGRMPAQFIINQEGFIDYLYYGASMSDIPGPDEILFILDH